MTNNPAHKKSPFKVWFLIPLIIFLGLIVMLFFRLGKPTEIVPDNALNRPVPPFALPLLSDTATIVTNDKLPDSPYLINVWGSWCPTCFIEHPFLLQLQAKGVKIVGVNYKDELEDAQAYLQREQNPFVFSIQDYAGNFAIDLGLTGAPETFVVDSKGDIRQHIVGEVAESNWRDRIAPCMTLLTQLDAQNTSLETPATQTDIAKVCK